MVRGKRTYTQEKIRLQQILKLETGQRMRQWSNIFKVQKQYFIFSKSIFPKQMQNKRLFIHTKAEGIHHWQICTTRNVKKKVP